MNDEDERWLYEFECACKGVRPQSQDDRLLVMALENISNPNRALDVPGDVEDTLRGKEAKRHIREEWDKHRRESLQGLSQEEITPLYNKFRYAMFKDMGLCAICGDDTHLDFSTCRRHTPPAKIGLPVINDRVDIVIEQYEYSMECKAAFKAWWERNKHLVVESGSLSDPVVRKAYVRYRNRYDRAWRGKPCKLGLR